MNDKDIIIFKDHAIIRMLERGITKKEILETIIKEKYLNNTMMIILAQVA